jgi:hypothetical protein
VLGQLLSTTIVGNGCVEAGAYGVSAPTTCWNACSSSQSYRDNRIDGTLNDYLGVLEQVEREVSMRRFMEKGRDCKVGRELKPLYPKKLT